MNRTCKRAFTLIEILIVVVILGILAAIVIPQFTDASQEAERSSVVSQLQTIRGQIELFKVQRPDDYVVWDPTADGWAPLIDFDYLHESPRNPFSNSSTVVAAAAVGEGWVWRAKDGASTTMTIYAIKADGTEFDPLVD